MTVALLLAVPNNARSDLAALEVIGPQSGTGFSNIGAVTKDAVRTAMTSADVLIELQQRDGDVMTATCRAVFDLDTDPNPSQSGQTVLVAFPVTGFTGKAVKISQFEASVDGVPVPKLQERVFFLHSGELSSLEEGWFPVEGDPDTFPLLGYWRDRWKSSRVAFLQAYAWTQKFSSGKRCRVEVRYSLTLHAQSLAYAKKYIKGASREVVPFDAMVVGPTDEKAFFLDYILRSGSTWKGPIGHERVTLRASPTSNIAFNRVDVTTVGRHVFDYNGLSQDWAERVRARISAEGINWKVADVVWELDREKPKEDILLEIPFSAVRIKKDARQP